MRQLVASRYWRQRPGLPDVAICRQTGDFQTSWRPVWRLENFGDFGGDFGDFFGDLDSHLAILATEAQLAIYDF